jgi:CelD/BcsL family acetyltransferase involved in cellulose biosynthesis
MHHGQPEVTSLDRLLPELAAHAPALDAASGGEAAATWRWWSCYLHEVADPQGRYRVLRWPDGTPGPLLQAGSRSALRAVSNYYTPLFQAAPAGAPVARWVAELAGAASLELGPIDTASADAWADALHASGWRCFRRAAFGNWYLPCEGLGFDAYLAQRPAVTRNTYKRKLRQFTSAHGGLRLSLVSSPEQLDEALVAYERVYSRSWKPLESHPAFIRSWARQCAAAGWLRLGLAWQGDEPIAAQFWYTAFGKAHVFKLAYDESATRMSAGTVLTGYLLQHALDHDQVREVDYLSGDDAYKQAWMSHRRQRWRLLAFNPRRLPGLLGAAEAEIRQWWRQLMRAGS